MILMAAEGSSHSSGRCREEKPITVHSYKKVTTPVTVLFGFDFRLYFNAPFLSLSWRYCCDNSSAFLLMYQLQVEAGVLVSLNSIALSFHKLLFCVFSLKPVSLHQAPAVGP